MFIKNKTYYIIVLILSVVLVLFSLSSVSAANFNNGHSSSDIQNFIDTGLGDDELVLEQGDYINTLYNLNISRKINIKSNGQVNIKSSTGGNLFNVTAKEVQILNLNISGYQTAIRSNSGGLSVIGNNITTNDISINITGSGDLYGISLENNTIISFFSGVSYGAIYVGASSGSTVGVSAKNNNILVNNSLSSYVMRFNAAYCDNSLFFENNNIIGTGSCVYIPADYSNNTLTFINNNITGTLGDAVVLFAGYSNNTITFINNDLNGTFGDGVMLRAYSGNNTITITNNNITGNSGNAVEIGVYRSNNAINITNNSLTGTLGSSNYIYLYGYGFKNTIIFCNNNITGDQNGVYLSAHYTNDSTINFTNNNIKGTSGDGVVLVAEGSNISATFTNNNITGIAGFGFLMEAAPNSNNIITITNNNITGTDYSVGIYVYESNNAININNNNITGIGGCGFAMYSYDSNNTIIISNNNITGTSGYGIDLYADGSNNTALSFIGNNIVGSDYAMYIYSYDQFNGLSLLNNTFKSDDIGLYFALDGGVLSDILVKGNTIFALNIGIGVNEISPSSVNLTVNYNRIIASVGLDFTTTDAGSSFDYNWWGVNDISSKIIGFDTNNHYILNITNLTSLTNVHPGDKVNFALLVLNTTLTNEGVENLPYFVITGLFNNENYNTTTDDLFVYQFTVPSEGIHTIDALLDEQYVSLEFNASKCNTSSTIVVPDDARTGKTLNITGIASDDDGNPLANTQITVTIDGVAYNVTTDSNGRWTLAYKPTKTGNINASVSWTGNNIYNGFTNSTNFNIKKGNITVVITVDENPDGSVTITANANDEDGDPIVGHPVDFYLDDELIGSGITDANGISSLTVPASKITNGVHTFKVIVIGNGQFNDGEASTEFEKMSDPIDNTTNKTTNNTTNKTSNNPAAVAAMKDTGIPIIAILIILLTALGITIRKKQD